MTHSSPATASSADALLSRMERVRVLASQLVRQAADHDDLVQEVVARALANPTQLVGDPEPWIRRVLKNLAIDRQRSTARRSAHEEAAKDKDAVAQSTAESVERAEKQRDLVNAVLKLNDPYRTVILKRFFDGLPPREIAKELGVPVATVKKQQERGMAMLRKELEARYGDKGSWAVALLPLLPKSALKGLTPGGVAWFGVRSMAVGAATLGVCAFAWVIVGPGRSQQGAELGIIERAPALVAPDDADQVDGVALVDQAPSGLVPITRTTGVAPSVTTTARIFRGTFVDLQGAPVQDVVAQCRLETEPDDADLGERSAGSDAGVVEARLAAEWEGLIVARVEAAGYAPAEFRFRPESTEWDAASALDVGVQTLFPEADLSVRVLDPQGEPLLGWTVSYFYYGGGDRLELGQAAADPISGAARFDGIAAASVEVRAEHPSGLSLNHPRRRLSPGELNRIDLVHVGPNPDQRLGMNVEFPGAAAASEMEPVEFKLVRLGEIVRTLEVGATDRYAAFDGLEPGAYELRVDDPRFEPVALAAEVGASLKVQLEGSATLELVVTGRRGQAAADLEIELVDLEGHAAQRLRLDDVDGALTGRLMPQAGFSLVVTAPDGRRAAIAVEALRPRETRVLSVALGEGVRNLTATVVRGGKGEPVVGADVAFVRGIVSQDPVVEAGFLEQLRTGVPQPGVRFLGRGRTGATGSVTLPVPSAEADGIVTVVALAGDYVWGAVRGDAVQLRLAARGGLSVALEGAPDGLPEGVALTVGDAKGGPNQSARFGPGMVLAQGDNGLWVANDVPCGEATLRLMFSDFNHRGRGTTLGGVSGPVGYPLGAVSIKPSSVSEIAIDVRDWMPGRVDLEIQHAGRPVRDAIVELEPWDSHDGLPQPAKTGVTVSRRLLRLTAGVGRARFPVVPKGRWRVRVRDANWLWTTELGQLNVDAGAKIEQSHSLELIEGSVTLLDPTSAAPMVHRSVWVELRPGARAIWPTDSQGKLSLRLGPGTYRLFEAEDALSPIATLEWGPAGGVLRD